MPLSILEHLQKHIDGTLAPGESSRMDYPPPIARTLGFRLVAIEDGGATLEMRTDPSRHGNPMGTIHGGVLCDLADAAIGTAHAVALQEGESFTSVDLRINFFRPVWEATISAKATAVHRGKTTSYYECAITRDDGKLVAMVTSTVMTLRGDQSVGR
jgi:uncharacterized protein (TIGR00369 family)